jgi:hypothetical protein
LIDLRQVADRTTGRIPTTIKFFKALACQEIRDRGTTATAITLLRR